MYLFIRMPIGLWNAPGTFQRSIDVVLATVKWQFSMVYVKDIVICFETQETHTRHTREYLTLLSKTGVILKLKKCQFITEPIDYLGQLIRPRRLKHASHTTDAILGTQEPTSITELRSFLFPCNVFRRFVPNFARLAAPLILKLRKVHPARFGSLNKK